MINNDILRRVSTIFDLSDEKILTIFALGQCKMTAAQLSDFYKEKDDKTYKEILDVELAGFLNGLIIEKRGPSDGPKRDNEQILTNNIVFNKVKIALALKADDVTEILKTSEINLGKHELSALFRNANHKHYKVCTDETLSGFLKGLKEKLKS